MHASIALHIVPIEGPVLHFAARVQIPPEHEIRPLQQMARNLDVSDIRRVVLRVDVVVSQNAVCVKEVDEPPLAVFEVFVDTLNLFFVDDRLLVLGFLLVPDAPLCLLLAMNNIRREIPL